MGWSPTTHATEFASSTLPLQLRRQLRVDEADVAEAVKRVAAKRGRWASQIADRVLAAALDVKIAKDEDDDSAS